MASLQAALERLATALEQAVPLLQAVVSNRRVHSSSASIHNAQDANGEPALHSPSLVLNSLPPEVSTAEAAKILGVSKDTVLNKDNGMLEYRNTAAPSSSRPIFLFSLQSVLALRTTYRTDSPAPFQKSESPRRAAAPRKKYKHLRLSDG